MDERTLKVPNNSTPLLINRIYIVLYFLKRKIKVVKKCHQSCGSCLT